MQSFYLVRYVRTERHLEPIAGRVIGYDEEFQVVMAREEARIEDAMHFESREAAVLWLERRGHQLQTFDRWYEVVEVGHPFRGDKVPDRVWTFNEVQRGVAF